jgi:hypothetical protein
VLRVVVCSLSVATSGGSGLESGPWRAGDRAPSANALVGPSLRTDHLRHAALPPGLKLLAKAILVAASVRPKGYEDGQDLDP